MDPDPRPAPSVLLLASASGTSPDDSVAMPASMAAVLGRGPEVPGLVLATSGSL